LQALVDNITQSLAQITQAAADNTAVSGALTPATFHAAGIQGVSASNLGLINQWLDTDATTALPPTPRKNPEFGRCGCQNSGFGRRAADTGAKLANADISALGLSSVLGVDTKLNLFNDILDKATSQSADTAAKLQDMANRVDRIIQTAQGQPLAQALTAQDFAALGLVGVDDANLSMVLAAIDTAVIGTDARPVDSLAELQTLIQTVNWLSSTARPAWSKRPRVSAPTNWPMACKPWSLCLRVPVSEMC
jgi:hypothetical protein